MKKMKNDKKTQDKSDIKDKTILKPCRRGSKNKRFIKTETQLQTFIPWFSAYFVDFFHCLYFDLTLLLPVYKRRKN